MKLAIYCLKGIVQNTVRKQKNRTQNCLPNHYALIGEIRFAQKKSIQGDNGNNNNNNNTLLLSPYSGRGTLHAHTLPNNLVKELLSLLYRANRVFQDLENFCHGSS